MRLCFLLLLLLGITSTVTHAQDANPYWVRAIDWSVSGDQIAFATQSGNMQVFDSDTGEVILDLQDQSFIFALAWSPDGTKIAISKVSHADIDYRIDVLDVASGSILHSFQGYVGSLAWSPDGTQLAAVGDGGASGPHPWANVWNTETGTRVFSPRIGESNSVAWSPDGTILAIGRISEIQLWNIKTQKHVKTIDVPGYAFSLDWSPAGTHIASAEVYNGEDAAVRIRDASTGQILKTFEEPTNVISSVEWNPLGTMVAASSTDKTVYVWDIASGDTLEMYQTNERVFDLAFSPFGGRLVYGETITGVLPIPLLTNSVVQLVVPAPSLALLNDIQSACVPATSLVSLPATDDLTTYIDAVKADASISPACAADLIAVAQALQAEQSTSP